MGIEYAASTWLSPVVDTAVDAVSTSYLASASDIFGGWGSTAVSAGSTIWNWMDDSDNSGAMNLIAAGGTGLANYMMDDEDSYTGAMGAADAKELAAMNNASAEKRIAMQIAFQEKQLAEGTNRLRRHNESFQKGEKTYARD
jgi:hypothetical protein